MGKPQAGRGLGRIKIPFKRTFFPDSAAKAPYHGTGLEYRPGVKGRPPRRGAVKRKNPASGEKENAHFQGNMGLVHLTEPPELS
jgi:hypothetical protein